MSNTLNVLVAEDDFFVKEEILSILEGLGHKVVYHASNGKDALEKTLELSPDVVLMDIGMREMNGIEAAKKIQVHKPTPIVFLTAYETQDILQMATEAGASAYLTKPPKAPEIEWAITVSVARHKDILTINTLNAELQKNIDTQNETLLKLSESEEKFRSFFNSVATGMAIVGLDGKALLVNPTFCQHSGYSEAEALEMTVIDVTHPDDRQETMQHYNEIRTGKRKNVEYEKRYLHKDGHIVWGHTTIAGIYDQQGALTGYAANVQDITPRKQAENEIEAFAYTVSHELRTPLATIMGYADFLLLSCDKHMDDKARECLNQIVSMTERMSNLTDDLLTLATAGQVQSQVEEVDTKEVANEVICNLSEQLKKVGGSISVGDLPVVIFVRSLLFQIFDNLIGNAIQYGCKPGGVIEVGGKVEGNRARFFVRDHGPGIPLEERAKIFDVFIRGATSKETKGSGIGLATVQKIVKIFGDGRVWLEETPDGGSTFWVEFACVADYSVITTKM